jgi:hypothetical protein
MLRHIRFEVIINFELTSIFWFNILYVETTLMATMLVYGVVRYKFKFNFLL